MICDEDVARFAQLFRGYDRAHGIFVVGAPTNGKVHGKATTVRDAVVRKHYRDHLLGSRGLGIVPLRADGSVLFGAIDLDDTTCDHIALERRVRELDLPLVVCRSKSGGAHLYCFLARAGPPPVLRHALGTWAAQLGFPPQTEIFPKQVARAGDEPGNWINLPYFEAERTMRYAIIDARAAPVGEFLAAAEAGQVDPDHLSRVPSVSEGGRNNALFEHVCSLRAGGAEGNELMAAAATFNHERCKPPLDNREVRSIVRSALRYPSGPRRDDPIDEINRTFAQVVVGGKVLILWEEGSGIRFLSKEGFKDILADRTVSREGRPSVPAASYWLRHPSRRLYHDIVFEPGERQTPQTYNLFRGWGVVPRLGDCSLILNHIREVVARGHADNAHWLISWMADIFQHPDKKKERRPCS